MSTYTYPSQFDVDRARELGQLVKAAYAQLDAYQRKVPWQIPAGYTAVAPNGAVGPLQTKEIWRLPGQVMEWLGDLVSARVPETPFGFVATKDNDVFVIIRGTQTPLEWFDDATAKPVPFLPFNQSWGTVTLGFLTLYKELGAQIIAAIRSLQNIRTIYIAGHSLGGALAQLAAADIASGFGTNPVTYIFSSPRAGTPSFAAEFGRRQLPLWRIFNTEDLVPTLPPAAVEVSAPNMGMLHAGPVVDGILKLVQLSPVGYQHVGYPIAVTFHGDTVSENHSLDTLCQSL